MKTLTFILALSLFAVGGCDRASEEGCREAVRNIFAVTGLDKSDTGPDEHAAIRSCRANASKQAVQCMINARTLEDLEKCEGGLADELAKQKQTGDEPAEE